MYIRFWCLNTRIDWTSSKFNLFTSYEFQIRIIHQFVNLILVITLRSIRWSEYFLGWGTTVNMKMSFAVVNITHFSTFYSKNPQIFVRIQKLTFSIYVNANLMKGLENIEKSCVLFFNKTIHNIKPTGMWPTWENFRFFKPFCNQRITNDPIH